MNANRLVLLYVCLTLALVSSTALAGKVTTSVRLPLDDTITMVDHDQVQSQISISGTVHVVSQVFQDSDGNLLAGLHVNLADVKAIGDDGSQWVGVGAEQFPPDPIFPPDPVHTSMQFTLIPLGTGHPPEPGEPPTVSLTLVFDIDGNLSDQCSAAGVGRELPPSPCDTGTVPR